MGMRCKLCLKAGVVYDAVPGTDLCATHTTKPEDVDRENSTVPPPARKSRLKHIPGSDEEDANARLPDRRDQFKSTESKEANATSSAKWRRENKFKQLRGLKTPSPVKTRAKEDTEGNQATRIHSSLPHRCASSLKSTRHRSESTKGTRPTPFCSLLLHP